MLLVKMSPIQRKLYKAFMDMMGDFSIAAWANANPLKAFSVCCKVTTTTQWWLCTYSVHALQIKQSETVVVYI